MGDRDGKVEPVTINIVPGKTAPRYDAHTTELTPVNATITERGMASGWPMVDLKFTDPDGKHFAFTTSGRMLLALAGAIQGVVVRNGHEPDYVPLLVLCLQGQHPHAQAMDNALSEIADSIRMRIATQLGAAPDGIVPDVPGFRAAVREALLDVLTS